MRKLLERISGHSYDHPWRILTILMLVIAGVAFGAASNMKTPTNEVTIPGTEANLGLERMNSLFPDSGKSSARVVIAAPAGRTLDAYQQKIMSMTSELDAAHGIKQAISPFQNPNAMSSDHKTAIIALQLADNSWAINPKTTEAVDNIIQESRQGGLAVEQDGAIADNESRDILGPKDLVSLAIALAILVITFGSLVAAGMPLLNALLAVGISLAGLFSLIQLIDINSTTPALAAMLGLAVGIDYSLFILNRYRDYLLAGESYREATVHAVRTAGSAVVFAATTVVIALSALSVVRIPFMTTMGLAAAATVAMAAIVAIFFLPAVLRLAGPRFVSKKVRAKINTTRRASTAEAKITKTTLWGRWGAFVARRPVISIIIPLIVIGLVALPVQSLTLGLPTDQYAAKTTTQRKAYDTVSNSFGVGFNAPLNVVVEGMQPMTNTEIAATKSELQMQAKSHPESLEPPQNNIEQFIKMQSLRTIGDKIARQDNVQKVIPMMITKDGTGGVLQVIPKTAPYDEATKDLIYTLRSENNQQAWAGQDVRFAVTGPTALQIDTNTKLARAIPFYLLVVVGLSFVLLIVAFRSILVPIKATLGYLLSLAAMFGALVAVFQWGWFGLAAVPAPIVSFIPILGTGILFGLAMDYEFFLVSSMREEYARTGNAKKAVVSGFGLGGKVVTIAAAIMITVFAGFISNDNSTVQALGFALAVGILVDAFLVRMIIVPATMTLAGKHAWWIPKWLDRILPNLPISEK